MQQRLIESLEQAPQPAHIKKHKVEFSDTMYKNNTPTFETLYEVKGSKEKDKCTILRVDRNVLQRLIIVYGAGREVDLLNVLSHELRKTVSFTTYSISLLFKFK